MLGKRLVGMAAALALGAAWLGICAPAAQGQYYPTFMSQVGYGQNVSQFVASGDVNGDGRLDLVATDSNSLTGEIKVRVLLGNADGTFTAGPVLIPPLNPLNPSETVPAKLALADLRHVGVPDLVLVYQGYIHVVGVFRNDGHGVFGDPTFLSVPSAESVALGDLNGDGWPDLVATVFAGPGNAQPIVVALNNGDGTFGTPVPYGDINTALCKGVALADLNHDGNLDVIVTHFDGVGVLLGDGHGHLDTQVNYSCNPRVGQGGGEMVIDDFDGDGRLDVAVETGGNGTVDVFRGNGDGTLNPKVSYSSGFGALSNIATADVNGDGVLDFVVTFQDNPGGLAVLLGNGDATFSSPQHYSPGGIYYWALINDFNGDGWPDLAIGGAHHLSDFSTSVLLQVPPTGSCCDPATYGCSVTLREDCAAGGSWIVGGSCTPNPCPYVVTMNSTTWATCSTTTSLTVTIDVTGAFRTVAGGQFFIGWDPRLSLSDVSAGPGLNLFYNFPDAGGQDIAVGVPDGGALRGGQTMVTLTFTVNANQSLACATNSLVYFRSSDIPSRLADDQANDLSATMADLAPRPGNLVGPSFPNIDAVGLNLDQGSCSAATYTLPPVIATDSCGRPVTATASVTFPYAFQPGGQYVTWSATDSCGNTSTAQQYVYVVPTKVLSVTLELDGHPTGSFDRCIQFGLYADDACPPVQTLNADMIFTNGVGTVNLTIPCGNYTAITATDPLHTLRRTGLLGSANFAVSGSTYVADFTTTTGKPLWGGNFNNDRYIDILDFGGYSGQAASHPDVNASACGYATNYRNADFDSDGTVGAADFTFIQYNFLKRRDLDPCGASIADEGPVSDISVADLVARGMRDLAMADFNLDGRLNAADIDWVAQHGLPRCTADFNDDQLTDVQDIFAFLNAWFMDHPKADIDGNTRTDVQDIFAFLSVWFQGC
jgi:hypothetical protein